MSSDRSHAILGGSTASRWSVCPGSIFYLKDMPPEPPSEHALIGTAVHNAVEIALSDFLTHKQEGTDPKARRDKWAISPEAVPYVEGYVQTVWKEVLKESITGKFYGLEEQVILDDKLSMSGYVDFWCVHVDDRAKRVGIIGDYKHGYHHVTAAGNAQLAFYSVALQKTFENYGKPLDYVRAFIYQPRAQGKSAYEETTFTRAQLITWQKRFYKAAESIFVTKKPKFKAGEHCRFCRAQAMCKTYQKEIKLKTSLDLIDAADAALPAPETISEEHLVQIILHEKKLLAFVKACKKYCFEKLAAGKEVSGLKLVEGRGRRAWLPDIEKVGVELKRLGVSDPFEKSLKTLGEIEAELKLNYKGAEIKKLLAPLAPQGKAPVVLVPEDDERERIADSKSLLPDDLVIDE